IKEIIPFSDDELTPEKIEDATRRTLQVITKIEKLFDLSHRQAAQLENTAKSNKRAYSRARGRLARTRIEMSQLARSLHLKEREKKRLIDLLRHTAERMHTLEREIDRLERRASATRGDTAGARKELAGGPFERKQ